MYMYVMSQLTLFAFVKLGHQRRRCKSQARSRCWIHLRQIQCTQVSHFNKSEYETKTSIPSTMDHVNNRLILVMSEGGYPKNTILSTWQQWQLKIRQPRSNGVAGFHLILSHDNKLGSKASCNKHTFMTGIALKIKILERSKRLISNTHNIRTLLHCVLWCGKYVRTCNGKVVQLCRNIWRFAR